MKISLYYLFLILSVCLIYVQGTEVGSCVDVDAPRPVEVDIVNCTVPPCVFYLNSTGVMNIIFKSPRYLENIAPQAIAHIYGINVTYPLDQKDACEGMTNTPCPLAEGEWVEYMFEMFVLSIFPEVGLNLEFSLLDLDANREPFICFVVDLSLKKK